MITKEMLERLRAQRPKRNVRLDYTPNDPLFVRVVTCTHAEHNRKILMGERALTLAGQELLADFRKEKQQGLTKAQFNHHSEELKP